jgi:hypothetical protein
MTKTRPGEIPEGYPFACSDPQLQELLHQLSYDLRHYVADPLNSPFLAAKLQLGLNEQQARTVRRGMKSSNRVAALALIFSLVSTVLSGTAAYYAYDAGQSSDTWQRDQMAILRTLRREAAAARKSMDTVQVLMQEAKSTGTARRRR